MYCLSKGSYFFAITNNRIVIYETKQKSKSYVYLKRKSYI